MYCSKVQLLITEAADAQPTACSDRLTTSKTHRAITCGAGATRRSENCLVWQTSSVDAARLDETDASSAVINIGSSSELSLSLEHRSMITWKQRLQTTSEV